MAPSEPLVADAPTPAPLPVRNRRTAVVLVAWIALLMTVAVVVAWFRN